MFFLRNRRNHSQPTDFRGAHSEDVRGERRVLVQVPAVVDGGMRVLPVLAEAQAGLHLLLELPRRLHQHPTYLISAPYTKNLGSTEELVLLNYKPEFTSCFKHK